MNRFCTIHGFISTKRCYKCQKPNENTVGALNNGTKWNKSRKARIEHDGFNCVECSANGDVATGTLFVHHVKARRQYDHLKWDFDNLATLCHEHHLQYEKDVHGIEFRRKFGNLK